MSKNETDTAGAQFAPAPLLGQKWRLLHHCKNIRGHRSEEWELIQLLPASEPQKRWPVIIGSSSSPPPDADGGCSLHIPDAAKAARTVSKLLDDANNTSDSFSRNSPPSAGRTKPDGSGSWWYRAYRYIGVVCGFWPNDKKLSDCDR